MKNSIKTLGVVACMAVGIFAATFINKALAQPREGYFQTGPVDVGLSGSAYLPAATTNTPRGTSTNTIFNATRSGLCIFEAEMLCTNANKMKTGDGVIINLDGGMVNSHTDRSWVTNALQIVCVPGLGATLYGQLVTNLTAQTALQRYPYYRIGEYWNTNVSGTNFSNVKARLYNVPPGGE